MIEITRESALEGLQAFVAEEGEDFVYPRNLNVASACKYVYDGKPDCLVGRYLHSIGIPLERLERADEFTNGAVSLLAQLRDEGLVTLDKGVVDVLCEAQEAQDHGESWGNALQRASAV